jgi:hypothetical protein
MNFLVLIDLELLVIAKRQFDAPNHDEFYQRFLTLKVANEWAGKYGGKWLFSELLFKLLWEAYPYCSEVHRRKDFKNIFLKWFQDLRAKGTIQPVTSLNQPTLEIRPDTYSSYSRQDYPELDQEWRNVLARQVDLMPNHTVVFSVPGKPTEIILTDTSNNTSQTFLLIPFKNEQEWLKELEKIDPWVKKKLPKKGEYPYEPHEPWDGKIFPPGKNRKDGFLDKKEREWVFDRLHKNHWDVQCPKQGKDLYFEVGMWGSEKEGQLFPGSNDPSICDK